MPEFSQGARCYRTARVRTVRAISDSRLIRVYKGAPSLAGSLKRTTRLGEGRIELEYGHRSNPLNEVKFVEGDFQGDGDLTADSLLINVFAAYHDSSRWAPYFGVGVGAARIKADDLQVSGQPLSSDSATVLAYQLGIGCEYRLTDNLGLDLGYRYFGSTRPKLSEENGESFKMDYACHSLVLGVKVGF